MGKTKTAVISGMPEEQKPGKAAYEEKRKKKETEKNLPAGKAGKKQVVGVGLKGGERIKVVTGDIPVKETEESEKKAKKYEAKVRGKKYKKAKGKIDKAKLYPLKEAVKLVKDTSYTSFDASIEMHMVTKKGGLSVNVQLPHFQGKKKSIEIADENTIKKLKAGKIDFDVLLATAEMMPRLVPFAKILGPKGLMPNPKNKTLIKGKKEAEKFSENSLTLKSEKKAPIIHTVIGKVSQKEAELVVNAESVIKALGEKQITKAYLASTMGPSVKLEIS